MSGHWSNREQIYTFILQLFFEVLVVGIEVETFWGFALILGIHFAVWANQCNSLYPSFSICEMEITLLWDLRWLGWAVPLRARSQGDFRNLKESASLWLSWEQSWFGLGMCQQKNWPQEGKSETVTFLLVMINAVKYEERPELLKEMCF